MDSMLRKHVLSEYASINKIEIITKTSLDKVSMESFDSDECISSTVGPTGITENVESSDLDEFVMSDPTKITKTIEISDPDSFVMVDPTYLTHAVENSDPDEFSMMGTTLETRCVETSDPDEMKMGQTKNTYTIEASDEDEFLLMQRVLYVPTFRNIFLQKGMRQIMEYKCV